MRLLPCLTGLLLITGVAAAQPANYNAGPGPGYDPSQQPMPGPAPDAQQPGGEQQAPQGGMPHHHMALRERFEAANATHDGRLTLDQARQAHFGVVAHNFEQIDADHKGYVTVQDIHVWRRAHRQAQMAQQQQPGPPQ